MTSYFFLYFNSATSNLVLQVVEGQRGPNIRDVSTGGRSKGWTKFTGRWEE